MAEAVPYASTEMVSGAHSVEDVTMPASLAIQTVRAYITAVEMTQATAYLKCLLVCCFWGVFP